MPRLIRAISWGFLVLLLLLFILGLLVLETTPGVALNSPPTDVQTAKQASSVINFSVHKAHRKGLLKSIELTAEDLAAAMQYFLARKQVEGNTLISLKESRMDCRITVKLPIPFANLFFNGILLAANEQNKLTLKSLSIGHITLSQSVAEWFVDRVARHTPLAEYLVFADQVIKDVRIADSRLQVTFNWSRQTVNQAQSLFLDEDARARLLVYYNALGEILNQASERSWVPLEAVTQPLFSLALTRSAEGGATQENYALILVLSAYVTGKNLASLLPPKGRRTNPLPRLILLHRRLDIAQHFMGSAGLAISGHRTLADLVGIAKEINDIHSGSGFSFTDLAADKAGALFGKMAVKAEKTARKLQQVMSQATDESAFMPNLSDLPENLSAAAFKERFGDINSQAFLDIKGQIEARIAGCTLYQ